MSSAVERALERLLAELGDEHADTKKDRLLALARDAAPRISKAERRRLDTDRLYDEAGLPRWSSTARR